jgi:V8-like Glu-specific endopeptidase
VAASFRSAEDLVQSLVDEVLTSDDVHRVNDPNGLWSSVASVAFETQDGRRGVIAVTLPRLKGVDSEA